MSNVAHVDRHYCSCCGVQRQEDGWMTHDKECMWHEAADFDAIMEDGERTIIFCPYVPKQFKENRHDKSS